MKASRRRKLYLVAACVAVPFLMGVAAPGAQTSQANDYPTADRADYVIGCMAANGNTQEALMKCSCAIDVIAGLMPYKDYDDAKTALSLAQEGGPRFGAFVQTPQMKVLIQNLHKAQAEANIQCFR